MVYSRVLERALREYMAKYDKQPTPLELQNYILDKMRCVNDSEKSGRRIRQVNSKGEIAAFLYKRKKLKK